MEEDRRELQPESIKMVLSNGPGQNFEIVHGSEMVRRNAKLVN